MPKQLNDKDIWSVLLGGEKKQKAELDQAEREILGHAHLYSHNNTWSMLDKKDNN